MRSLSILCSLVLVAVASRAVAMKPPSAASVGVLDRAGGELAGPAFLAVRGPVKLTLRTLSADVDVSTSNSTMVSARVTGGDGARVRLSEEGGDRVEISFDDAPTLRNGRLCITLPAHSDVEINSTSGSVVVNGTDGRVRARTASGDVRVRRAHSCELGSISGTVDVRDVGDARVDTVSGDTTIDSVPQLRYSSTSGDLSWSGRCAAGCRLEARTLSGDVSVRTSANSSFELRYQTQDGTLDDQLHLDHEVRPRAERSQRLRGRLGNGEGLVEVQTWHGDLALARLP